MKTKNNKSMSYIILGILFVLFNVLAFVIPTDKTATFWIAYVFSVVAFAAQLIVWNIAFKKDDELKSKFLCIPVIHVGIVYLIVQLIAFAVFMALPQTPYWVSVVVCAVILAFAAIAMIGTKVGRDAIENTEAHVKTKVFYIKSLQVDVEILAESESDPAIKAELSKLAENIRFSDPMSNEVLADIENSIKEKVALLKTSADKQPIMTEVNSLLAERNKKAKILK